ncbi:MAG: RpiR family carbohydrate utilization transcriptional regulator [Candidatus Endobugula sp.]|jgi:RpiR family carbohydrate utilization transcriptional regulator
MKPALLSQHIANTMGRLRKSERKVAEYVLNHQQEVIHLRVIDVAKRSEVSEPTVIRFCRAIGCNGFQDFKLTLAQQLAASPSFGKIAITDTDSTADFSKKVFDGAIDTLLYVRDSVDIDHLHQAVNAITAASRIEFFGFGASGAVAVDAYHKFFRLQLAAAAHSDHHFQNMSAASLSPGDVVVAISHSGRTKALIDSMSLAKDAGAVVISICPSNTPIADIADIPIYVDVEEDIEIYTPLCSRLAHLVVIDVLAMGVAQKKGPDLKAHLFKLKQGLKSVRV